MADIADGEFTDEFSLFSITVDSTDIFDKLKELCQIYRLSASDLVMSWVAFCHTGKKHIGLNLENLDHFERDRLSKAKPAVTPQTRRPAPKMYTIDTLQEAVDADAADELLGAYTGLSTPSGKVSNKRQVTPDTNFAAKRMTGVGRSPVAPFSPASFSPGSATPSRKYGGRINAGEAVCSYNPDKKLSWKSGRVKPCTVTQYDASAALTGRVKYMFQKLTDKAHVLNDMIEDMGAFLKKEHNIEEFAHVALPAQEEVMVTGRVCCDSVGKLNAKSTVLEGSRETSAGKQIMLDLDQLPSYSLFPGQLVAMEGSNCTGHRFVAKQIFENVPLPLPEKTPKLKDGPISVVVAAGPFTTSDSMMYEPLADLVKYLQRESPDICILLGPFLDAKNSETLKNLRGVTFEQFFQNTVEKVISATQRSNIQLVLVPSQRDVHHDYVYPQPPFALKVDEKRVHLVSDPCTIRIDDVVIGITSTDVLFHLGAEEISCHPGSTDRLARLTQHLLFQHSYYPLCPPSEDVNVDYDHFENHGKMPITPHILVVPSDLRYFIKSVSGCCCINPGRLTKGQIGGTMARFVIDAPQLNTPRGSVLDSMQAEIVRI